MAPIRKLYNCLTSNVCDELMVMQLNMCRTCGSSCLLEYIHWLCSKLLYSLPLNSVDCLPQHTTMKMCSHAGLESHHNSISCVFKSRTIFVIESVLLVLGCVCFPCVGQMFVLTRRCPCWGAVSLVSRLLPAWLRCGNRAATATDGVWATREGKSKNTFTMQKHLTHIDHYFSMKTSHS